MADGYAGGGGGGGGGGAWGTSFNEPTDQPNGVYWIGTNGQVYVKGGSGTNAAGAADNNTDNYWSSRGFVRIADPNPGSTPQPTGRSGSLGGGSAGTAADIADEQAYWQDQIANADQQLARFPQQEAVLRQNAEGAYRSAYDRLVGDKNTTERDYNTKRGQTVEDNIVAKNEINTSVRNRNTGLQRLLGSRGAGNSSAAQILAPFAAAQEGNKQRGAVQKTYGRNIQGLDTAWGDYQKDWDESAGDLAVQRDNSIQQGVAGLRQSEAGLIEAKGNAAVQKAMAGGANYTQARMQRVPYTQRIQELIGQIDAAGGVKNFTPKTVAYKAPELGAYTYDRYGAPVAGSGVNPNMAQQAGAYWTLLGKDKERRV